MKTFSENILQFIAQILILYIDLLLIIVEKYTETFGDNHLLALLIAAALLYTINQIDKINIHSNNIKDLINNINYLNDNISIQEENIALLFEEKECAKIEIANFKKQINKLKREIKKYE